MARGMINGTALRLLRDQGLIPLKEFLAQKNISRTTFYRRQIPNRVISGRVFVHAEAARFILTKPELRKIQKENEDSDKFRRIASELKKETESEASARYREFLVTEFSAQKETFVFKDFEDKK